MKRWLFFILLSFLLIACNSQHYAHPHVIIETDAGDMEAKIYTDKAPKTATQFLKNVENGLYKHSSFYRILNDDNQPSDAVKSELIQGGIWKTNYQKSLSIPSIPHETTKQTGILHLNGTLSMARLAPGTANTEFFICVGDQPGFDFGGENNPDGQGYAAFGKIVKGLGVLTTIYNRPENYQSFVPPVVIINIKKL